MFKTDIHYSTDMERSVLGICLLQPNAYGQIYGNLKAEMFYNESHKTIFETASEMFQKGIPIDLLTVSDYLCRKKNVLEFPEGKTPFFLTSLTIQVVSDTNLSYWAMCIEEMWRERELIEITHSGMGELTGFEAANDILQRTQNLLSGATSEVFSDMPTLMVQMYKHQAEMNKTGGVGMGVGMQTIDRRQGGFHAGDLIVIGARPGVGKSSLMGQWALSMAHNGKSVGIISLEMSNTQIAARLAAIDTQTDFSVFFRGLNIDEKEKENIYNRISLTTSTLPIYVSDKTGVNILDIKASAARLKKLHNLDALFIDYLQLLDPISAKSNRNREQEVSEMSRGCKILAKDLGIPVFILAQLNRESIKRKGAERYPALSDLRESGSLEQDADVVVFLHKDYNVGIEVDENGNSTINQANLVVRKWRNAESNLNIPLTWVGNQMRFTEGMQNNFMPITNVKNYNTSDEEDIF